METFKLVLDAIRTLGLMFLFRHKISWVLEYNIPTGLKQIILGFEPKLLKRYSNRHTRYREEYLVYIFGFV